jgi:hypothetical protein
MCLKFRIAHCQSRIWDGAMIRGIVATIEIAFLSALILATRCANYPDVFVAGNIYFVDADCYARMTRVQMCAEKPGLIVRHHDFENFPYGTTPHTTAPFDYLILSLSLLLKPFTAQPLDLAGAWISPLLALIAGWFLWWWSRRMRFRYRWVMLILYAISPILVHGTELGRPDHQSLLILLVTIALCAEWRVQMKSAATATSTEANKWAVMSGVAWGLAMWVSAYEPLVIFFIVTATAFLTNRAVLFGRDRRAGWILFAAIIVIALLIERRVPSVAIFQSKPSFGNWARTIGELAHISPVNPVWFHWCGFLLLVAPFLIWINVIKKFKSSQWAMPWFVPALLAATYGLTIWQARWGYFFVLIFALALPALLAPIKSRVVIWTAFVLSVFPILGDWDQKLWPNEEQLASRVEKRIESAQIRKLALSLRSSEVHPFLAPWWLSPSIAYWSGQPGGAGSSHEGLSGIEDSARFFLAEDLQRARKILQKRRVVWVFAYDSERVAQNSAAIVNERVPPHPLCRVLDRTPSQVPPFLTFFAQNSACKLYRVARVER